MTYRTVFLTVQGAHFEDLEDQAGIELQKVCHGAYAWAITGITARESEWPLPNPDHPWEADVVAELTPTEGCIHVWRGIDLVLRCEFCDAERPEKEPA